MKGKWHFVFTTTFLILLWVIFGVVLQKPYFTITQIIAAVPISFFPDVDQNFSFLGHRNWFTHSIILWVIIYIFNPHFIFLTLQLGIGFHCLCDIRLRPEKQVGYYTIKWFKGKGLNGLQSTAWLNLNFWISFILFAVIVLIN